MILTDSMIQQACSEGTVGISPFDVQQIQPASYDLRVGPEAAVSSHHGKVNIKEKGFVELDAGDFAVLVTEEVISLDNQHSGRFGLRSKWARKGLLATTGPQVDPGFKGRLSVGLTNLTSRKIALSHQDDFLSVEFHRLSEPVQQPYSGPYQSQSSLSNEDLEAVLEREVMSLSEMNTTLRSLAVNVKSLEESITSMKWLIGMGIAMIGIIMAMIGVILAIKT